MEEAVKHFFLELFFPSFCLGCGLEGTFLCQDCKATLDIAEHQYCLCNKNPLRLPREETLTGKCGRCADKKLSGIFCALAYQEKLLTRKLVQQFKYQPHIKSLAKPLAGILAEHLLLVGKNTGQVWANGILVPVPMEIKKMKKRGYNQAELLARELGQIINVPTMSYLLTKIQPTRPQMELSKEEREKNLAGAFQIKNPADVAGKKIFLIDDVYTTGSTMEECAKTLKEAGAKSVWAITIAREA